MQGIRLLKYGMAWTGVGAVVGLLLILDLVFGIPQAIVGYVIGSRQQGEKAENEAA